MSFATELAHATECIHTTATSDGGRRPTLILVRGEKNGQGRRFLPDRARIVDTTEAVRIYKHAVLRDPMFRRKPGLDKRKATDIVAQCVRLGIETRKVGQKRNLPKKNLVSFLRQTHDRLNALNVNLLKHPLQNERSNDVRHRDRDILQTPNKTSTSTSPDPRARNSGRTTSSTPLFTPGTAATHNT